MSTEAPEPKYLAKELSVVSVFEMPKPPVVQDAPLDDLAVLFKLAKRMEHLCLQEEGVGLHAVQAGIPWRMFITVIEERGLEVFINCQYEPVDERLGLSVESCLSLPKGEHGRRASFAVPRRYAIRLRGHRLVWEDGLALEPVDEVVEGFRAVVLQHETDHQLGRVIWEIGRLVEIMPRPAADASPSRA